MEKTLTAKQAYLAMFKFLDDYYQLTKADDIGAILGSMQMLEDGKPVDPGMWQEWEECVSDVLKNMP